MQKRAFLHTLAGAAAALIGTPLLAQPKPARSAALPTQAQTLVGVDHHGRKVDLDDHAGRMCLVTFFTFDCNLCFEDLQLMRQFHQGDKEKPFSQLAVCMDERRQDYLEYMRMLEQTIPRVPITRTCAWAGTATPSARSSPSPPTSCSTRRTSRCCGAKGCSCRPTGTSCGPGSANG